ncbi:MAG: guanylate kinase [Clostridia bacterium]|nr:guanylate kinase [Clostridia bacterium]
MANPGVLIVISGPSGSGKSTVTSKLLKDTRFAFSVSATTRAPRAGEEHGKHYFFITKEEFEALIDGGQMLEHAQYVGNYYGTPREPVERLLAEGKHVILEIETKGALQVKAAYPDAIMIMILPPDIETLEGRLRGRKSNTEEDIKNRLETAKSEIKIAREYDYLVINDTVENAVCEIKKIVDSETHRTAYNAEFIDNYIK